MTLFITFLIDLASGSDELSILLSITTFPFTNLVSVSMAICLGDLSYMFGIFLIIQVSSRLCFVHLRAENKMTRPLC